MLFDIPFLFDNYLEAWMVCDSPVGQSILSSARDGGIVALAYGPVGFRHVTNNRGPINTLEDFKGLKIRTMVAPMHIKNFRLLGANPTPVPWYTSSLDRTLFNLATGNSRGSGESSFFDL